MDSGRESDLRKPRLIGSISPPRSPRYELRFPVEFISDGEIISGECINISDSGLLAAFETPLEVWARGEVRLHAGERSRRVKVRVSRVDALNAGMAFIDDDDTDRRFIAAMIEELMEQRRREKKELTPPY